MTANPIRYRGYIYDTETGFYYLQSRYYDPEIGRFTNADGYISTGTGVLGYNMYAYCNNNPITYYDDIGQIPKDAKYRIDGKGKPYEHIHVTYRGKEYSWYLNPIAKDKKHSEDLGYNDLNDKLKERFSKIGVPDKYLNINKKTISNSNNSGIFVTPIVKSGYSIISTPMKPIKKQYVEMFLIEFLSRVYITDFPAFSHEYEFERFPIKYIDTDTMVMLSLAFITLVLLVTPALVNS